MLSFLFRLTGEYDVSFYLSVTVPIIAILLIASLITILFFVNKKRQVFFMNRVSTLPTTVRDYLVEVITLMKLNDQCNVN